MRLRDGDELFFREGRLDVLRHELLHHFALDVLGEAAANQCDGRFPGTKARNSRDARDFFRYFLARFRDFLGGDFQLEFALAGGFSFAHSLFVPITRLLESRTMQTFQTKFSHLWNFAQ